MDFPALSKFGCMLSAQFGDAYTVLWGFPGDSVVKNPPAKAGDAGDLGSIPWVRKIPWSRKWQPTPVFLLEKFHGQWSLEGYSPWDHKELGTSEQLCTHAHMQAVTSIVSISFF